MLDRTAATCKIWLARVPIDTRHLCRHLDTTEQQRRARFRHEADRDRFTAAATLLRIVVAERTDSQPADVRIVRTCDDCDRPHGRPRLHPDQDGVAGVEVSLTHAGGFVAVALAEGHAVGIDVEAVGRRYHDLLEHVCASTERDAITDARGFALTWVRKEAVLKADGRGLLTPPAHVVVSGPTEPPSVRSLSGEATPPYQLWDLDVDAGHVGAVAVRAQVRPRLETHDADGMLAR